MTISLSDMHDIFKTERITSVILDYQYGDKIDFLSLPFSPDFQKSITEPKEAFLLRIYHQLITNAHIQEIYSHFAASLNKHYRGRKEIMHDEDRHNLQVLLQPLSPLETITERLEKFARFKFWSINNGNISILSTLPFNITMSLLPRADSLTIYYCIDHWTTQLEDLDNRLSLHPRGGGLREMDKPIHSPSELEHLRKLALSLMPHKIRFGPPKKNIKARPKRKHLKSAISTVEERHESAVTIVSADQTLKIIPPKAPKTGCLRSLWLACTRSSRNSASVHPTVQFTNIGNTLIHQHR